jgi:hypothetical protein
MSSSKLSVHLLPNKRDCYINLPEALAKRLVSQYDEQRIARPVRVRRGTGKNFYFSFLKRKALNFQIISPEYLTCLTSTI